jgi:ADP-ribosyl-[dinitrogen reductase] hydrolase
MTPDQLKGALCGLLVGDALGVPYEFTPPDKLPPREQLEMTPPPNWPRAHQVPDGTWSDDGACALALLDSLLACRELDAHDLAQKLSSWQFEGAYAVDAQVFDIGITTSAAIRRFRSGVQAEEAGPDDENSNGNGSLMRVLPLVLWHRGPDFDLARDAMRQSLVTHGHLRSQLCCALFCLWARRIGEGVDCETAWTSATKTLRELLPALSRNATGEDDPLFADAALGIWQNELEWHIRPDDDLRGRGSGYVVDCLRSVRDALRESDFENVVKYAVALGYDTDTTACIAGGLAGLREGVEAIPARWMDKLRGKEIAAPIVNRLVAR